MNIYTVTMTIRISEVEAENEDDAINFVTEALEDEFSRIEFDNQMAEAN